MKDKLRNEVRKVLSEEIGVQQDIKGISDGLMDGVINQLRLNVEKISDGYAYELTTSIRTSESQKKNTNFDIVIVNITYQKSKNNKVKGKFEPKNIKAIEGGLFKVYIELEIECLDIDSIDNNKTISVISHELNHAFVYLKKFKLSPKTPVYNIVKNKLMAYFQHIEPLNNFLTMFYLNLPEEIQARVQEVGSIIPKIESDNYSDAVRELYLYQPINDAKRMVKYDSSELYKLPNETLDSFVQIFNRELLSSKDKFDYEDVEFKIISEPKKFFDYWTKFINFGGVKLNKKILNIVAKKFKVNEDKVISELDDSLITEILIINSGEYF